MTKKTETPKIEYETADKIPAVTRNSGVYRSILDIVDRENCAIKLPGGKGRSSGLKSYVKTNELPYTVTVRGSDCWVAPNVEEEA